MLVHTVTIIVKVVVGHAAGLRSERLNRWHGVVCISDSTISCTNRSAPMDGLWRLMVSLRRGETIGNAWNGRVVGIVRIVANLVWRNRAVRVGVLAIRHGVARIEPVVVVTAIVGRCNRTRADATRWLAKGVLRERCRIDGR